MCFVDPQLESETADPTGKQKALVLGISFESVVR